MGCLVSVWVQRSRDVMITPLLRQIDVATSFWPNNDVISTPCVSWEYLLYKKESRVSLSSPPLRLPTMTDRRVPESSVHVPCDVKPMPWWWRHVLTKSTKQHKAQPICMVVDKLFLVFPYGVLLEWRLCHLWRPPPCCLSLGCLDASRWPIVTSQYGDCHSD